MDALDELGLLNQPGAECMVGVIAAAIRRAVEDERRRRADPARPRPPAKIRGAGRRRPPVTDLAAKPVALEIDGGAL